MLEFQEAKSEQIKKLSLFSYEAEVSRENSIIQQAGYMQAAFSFVVMATLSATSLIITYKPENITYMLIFTMVTIVVFLQLVSLFFAIYAQHRYKAIYLGGPKSIRSEVNEKLAGKTDNSSLDNQYIDTLDMLYQRLYSNNSKRVESLIHAQYSMYASLGLAVLFYFGTCFFKIL